MLFESELNKHGIKFYTNLNEQPFIQGGIRYFLLDKDRIEIDKIVKSNNIQTSIESIGVNNFGFQSHLKKSYLWKVMGLGLFFIILFIIGLLMLNN